MKNIYLMLQTIALLFVIHYSRAQGNALFFDGANDYVNLNSLQAVFEPISDNFTVEFWMRADAAAQMELRPCMFAINLPAGENRLLLVMGGNSIGDDFLMIYGDGGFGPTGLYTGTDHIGDNECHHIAYTFSNGTGNVYLDGILVDSHNATFNITLNDRYSLGQEWDNANTSQFYNGMIDELRIWDHERTQTQIQQFMNLELIGNETGLIAYYDFNQGIPSGTNTGISTLTNSTATSGLDGTLVGFAMTGSTSNFVRNACSSSGCNDLDSSYVSQTSDITTNTTWSTKIHVPDNTVIVVDNAILDITNVDIVFGQCSGIDFINGATLRANNSVFRPCSMDDTWRGLHFDATSTFVHQINENTFKNAEIALLFTKDAMAEINSNTFSNCNEGVVMDVSLFTESIFGNNFVTNNSFPEYTNCYTTTSPTDVIHIHAIGTPEGNATSNMVINQNHFTMSNTSGTIIATAVDLLNSQATISENTLTNIEFGISINDPRSEVLIEGNEIENNYQFQKVSTASAISQINIFNSNGIFVSINNNELRNSINNSYVSGAIYLDRSSNIMVQNNRIEGFNIGINAENCSAVNFTENELSSISDIAIYLNENGASSTNYITCNDITMVMGIGTSIYALQTSRLTNITSNCVKDGRIAILVDGNGTIPVIRNNFLYNYRTGIQNNGHSGNIGTTSDPGMNTLWSNMSSGIDVASTTPITIANNFGQTNCTWATVSVQGNTAIHSTASCGHQITSANAVSQGNLNTKYTCDNLSSFILPGEQQGSKIVLPSISSAINFLSQSTNKINEICQLVALDGCDDFYLNELLASAGLETDEENLVYYQYYKSNNQYIAANEVLQALNSSKFYDFVAVEKILLKKLNGGNLTESDFNDLSLIITNPATESNRYNLAVGLTKTGTNHGTYRITMPASINEDYSMEGSNPIIGNQTILTVYPNPSENEINVQVLEGKNVSGQTLEIYDLYGNLVHHSTLDFLSGRTVINISTLAPGSYFILLESDGTKSERKKFIKM